MNPAHKSSGKLPFVDCYLTSRGLFEVCMRNMPDSRNCTKRFQTLVGARTYANLLADTFECRVFINHVRGANGHQK